MARRLPGRRRFLRSGLTTAAALAVVPRRVLGGPGYTAPSDELTKAIVGVGGMGRNHIEYAGARVVDFEGLRAWWRARLSAD